MEFNQLATKTKKLFTDLWTWIRQRPLNAVIAGVIFLTVVIGAILFIQFVLPTLVAIVFIIVFFWDDISKRLPQDAPPLLTLDDNGVCWQVTAFMFLIFSSMKEVLGSFTILPSSINDIYHHDNYRGAYNHSTILKLHLQRNQKDVTPADCDYIKKALQAGIDARLRDGHLAGNGWAAPASYNVPLIKVIDVRASELYIHIDILLTNTDKDVQAARLSDRPAPPPSTDDTDPLF